MSFFQPTKHDPSVLRRRLSAVVVLLLAAGLAGQFSRFFIGPDYVRGLIPFLDVDREKNLPTLFSAALMVFSSFLLFCVAQSRREREDPFRVHWWALGGLFLFLASDEWFSFHERLMLPLREAFGFRGPLFFAWVVPGFALVVVLALIYRRFMGSLPPQIRRQFLLSAAVFLTGALGVEMVGGWYFDAVGEVNFIYSLIVTVEEGCEFFGLIFFITALVDLLNLQEKLT